MMRFSISHLCDAVNKGDETKFRYTIERLREWAQEDINWLSALGGESGFAIVFGNINGVHDIETRYKRLCTAMLLVLENLPWHLVKMANDEIAFEEYYQFFEELLKVELKKA